MRALVPRARCGPPSSVDRSQQRRGAARRAIDAPEVSSARRGGCDHRRVTFIGGARSARPTVPSRAMQRALQRRRGDGRDDVAGPSPPTRGVERMGGAARPTSPRDTPESREARVRTDAEVAALRGVQRAHGGASRCDRRTHSAWTKSHTTAPCAAHGDPGVGHGGIRTRWRCSVLATTRDGGADARPRVRRG